MKNNHGFLQETSELFCSVAFVNKIGDAFKEWLFFFFKKLLIELFIYLLNEFGSLSVLFFKSKRFVLSFSLYVFIRDMWVSVEARGGCGILWTGGCEISSMGLGG